MSPPPEDTRTDDLSLSLSPLTLSRQAGRLLANLIVAGGSVLLKAATQAYQKALISECPLHTHADEQKSQS